MSMKLHMTSCWVLPPAGVCFDTGGYNIKTAAGMKNMKKVGVKAAGALLMNHFQTQHNSATWLGPSSTGT